MSNKSPEQIMETCRRAGEAAKAIIVADGFSGIVSISTIEDDGTLGTGAAVVCGKYADRALVAGCKPQARNLLDLVGMAAEMLKKDPTEHFHDTITGAMSLNVVAEEKSGGAE